MREVAARQRHLNALGLPLVEDAAACAWHKLVLVEDAADEWTPKVAVELEVVGNHCQAVVCLFGKRLFQLGPWGNA